MNFSQRVIDPIFNAINEAEKKLTNEKEKFDTGELNFKNIIHIKDLNFSYNKSNPVLNKLNFEIKPLTK